MDGQETRCPACATGLQGTEIGGVPAHVCATCKGTLLAQIDLARMLEALSVELLDSVDADTRLEAVGHADATVACPRCRGAMARVDYCAAGLAHFDRCVPCGLLWLGTDEVGTMALIWARMDRRLERTEKQTRAALAEADQFVTSVQLGGALGAERKAENILGTSVGRILARYLDT